MDRTTPELRWLRASVDSLPPAPTRRKRSATSTFLWETLRRGAEIGAIAPTTRELACAMTREAGVADARRIIELGAGTGAVTEQIVRAKPNSARLLAVERNSRFATVLASRFPEVQVAESCVSQFRRVADAAGLANADCILASLPWTQFSPTLCDATLQNIAELLSPNGRFTSIACYGPHFTPAGRRFRRALDAAFAEVAVTARTWRNLPPAFVYRCMRPRFHGSEPSQPPDAQTPR